MFKKLLMAMVLVFGLSGCMTMPDGNSEPDYALIEFGAIAGMTVIVTEIKVSPETTLLAHERLLTLHNTLTCTGANCPPFNLIVLESMVANALPIEYQALGVAAIRLIKSRAEMYLDPQLPDFDNLEIMRKISASVVMGMVQAMAPRVNQIKGG